MNDTTFEPHYTIQELAKIWGRGVSTVRRWVDLEPGVCRTQSPGSKSVVSTVPESVARRIHTKMLMQGPRAAAPPEIRRKGKPGKKTLTS